MNLHRYTLFTLFLSVLSLVLVVSYTAKVSKHLNELEQTKRLENQIQIDKQTLEQAESLSKQLNETR